MSTFFFTRKAGLRPRVEQCQVGSWHTLRLRFGDHHSFRSRRVAIICACFKQPAGSVAIQGVSRPVSKAVDKPCSMVVQESRNSPKCRVKLLRGHRMINQLLLQQSCLYVAHLSFRKLADAVMFDGRREAVGRRAGAFDAVSQALSTCMRRIKCQRSTVPERCRHEGMRSGPLRAP